MIENNWIVIAFLQVLNSSSTWYFLQIDKNYRACDFTTSFYTASIGLYSRSFKCVPSPRYTSKTSRSSIMWNDVSLM